MEKFVAFKGEIEKPHRSDGEAKNSSSFMSSRSAREHGTPSKKADR